ncbi:AAA family ATPase [thermophilic bacterium 2918]|uniref:AAA family ATPase n=2 Tax=Thermogemmata fonticola TaxID=2755323 RepID=A0A7V9AAG9_9BACT|nr:AAA family ATPase [Thermogemmata fonticola]
MSPRTSQPGDRPPAHVDRLDQVGRVRQLGQSTKPGFKKASEIKTAAVEWLWSDHIPVGSLTVLEGDPGHGKSTVTYDIAACVSAGLSIPFRDSAVEPAGVVIVQGEDDTESKVVPSLQAVGADLDRIAFIESLILPDDLREVESAVKRMSARLLVIDPITAFFGTSLNNDQSARKVLGPLQEMAKKWRLAVVLVRHQRKAGGRSEYQGAGSIGIIGAARSGLRVEDDPQKRPFTHRLVNFKGNLSRGSPVCYRTVRDDAGIITVEWSVYKPPVGFSLGSAKKSKMQEAEDFIYRLLGNGPMMSNEVFRLAQENSLARKTVERAKRRIGVVDWKEGDGKTTRTFWALPRPRLGFCTATALAVGELMRAAVVGSTGQHPRVVVDNNQVRVVRIHLDDRPILQLDVNTDERRGWIEAADGQEAVTFELDDPALWERFRSMMKEFGLTWADDEYARLTCKPD